MTGWGLRGDIYPGLLLTKGHDRKMTFLLGQTKKEISYGSRKEETQMAQTEETVRFHEEKTLFNFFRDIFLSRQLMPGEGDSERTSILSSSVIDRRLGGEDDSCRAKRKELASYGMKRNIQRWHELQRKGDFS
ncbi:hypothetical protein CEXT_261011 [Caerostris extrusa]|uniref:Uncharacterized protein n=1 Tax=Caerostris extrusa TaxID=172846 RepID=A0AAV4M2X1_CAEEX|nr:hypothetical protein CEXT_261011 [Caerostris extrusa]